MAEEILTAPVHRLPGGMVAIHPDAYTLLTTLPASIEALKTAGVNLSDDCDALIAAVNAANQKTSDWLNGCTLDNTSPE